MAFTFPHYDIYRINLKSIYRIYRIYRSNYLKCLFLLYFKICVVILWFHCIVEGGFTFSSAHNYFRLQRTCIKYNYILHAHPNYLTYFYTRSAILGTGVVGGKGFMLSRWTHDSRRGFQANI